LSYKITAINDCLWQTVAGEFKSNSYIYKYRITGECFIVDCGLDPRPLVQIIETNNLIPSAILCTHGHFDHIGGVHYLQNKYNCPALLHQNDIKVAKSSNFLLMAFKLKARIKVPDFKIISGGTNEFKIDDCNIRFMNVPGHTDGSCLVILDEYCFSGDTIYAQSVGLSGTPGEDADVLRRSLLSVWTDIPDTQLICPGHGPVANFISIKTSNSELLEFLRICQS
jgi:hydroxyacylglutathione hydrolase